MKAPLLALSLICIFSLSVQAQETPPAAAPAQPAPPEPSMQQACKADYKKLCAGVQPGGGRVVACLNSHKDDLTTACQEALLKAHPPAPKSDGAPAQPTKTQ
jgi:hypothetical protein